MVTIYEGVISILETFGFFNIILPWMLTYALIYGILLRTKIFGDPFSATNPNEARTARSISSIIAFSVATILISSTSVVLKIKEVLPLIILLIIIIFALVLVLAAIYAPKGQIEEKYIKWVALFGVALFILLMLNIFRIFSDSGFDSLEGYGDIIAAFGYLFVFAFIIWLLVRSPSGSSSEGSKESK